MNFFDNIFNLADLNLIAHSLVPYLWELQTISSTFSVLLLHFSIRFLPNVTTSNMLFVYCATIFFVLQFCPLIHIDLNPLRIGFQRQITPLVCLRTYTLHLSCKLCPTYIPPFPLFQNAICKCHTDFIISNHILLIHMGP